MNRRHFLQTASLVVPALWAGRLYALPPGGPRLLVVFLRGGYDCLNVFVPQSSADYYEARPSIAIARSPDLLQLDSEWALNPALAKPLKPMWDARQIAFVPFAGTDDLSRSHFETQDSIELGQPVEHPDLRTGFLARLTTVLGGHGSIAFTDSLPVSYRGDADVPNISLKSLAKPPFDERQSQILSDMYAHHALKAQVREGLDLRQQVSREMADEMQQANRDAISAKGFELEAQRIGRLLRTDYSIGFVDIGGWDTHVNENQVLAANLDSVGSGLQSLARELGPEWANTVVIVVSEFGRTFKENGSKGTDHGHGTMYWVAGGAISGGKVTGRQQAVTRAGLFENRDLPVLNNYRALLGGVMQRMWGLSSTQLELVFPAALPQDVGLV
ncbi:MAG TPA: DUF1501 domain-containing protein [Steroidobacteraceae bacterium]|nr:DUF1501 domain-containing protein [Steroidobacteraceae bacterium]